MKTFLFVLLAGVALVSAMPYGNDPEYAMVPDGEGNMKLVNINEDPEPESFFDAVADTVFLLFTRDNPTEAQRIDVGSDDLLRASNFRAEFPTR